MWEGGQEQGKADQTVAHSRQVDHVDFTDQIIHLDYTAHSELGGLKLRIDDACQYTWWLLDVSQKNCATIKGQIWAILGDSATLGDL